MLYCDLVLMWIYTWTLLSCTLSKYTLQKYLVPLLFKDDIIEKRPPAAKVSQLPRFSSPTWDLHFDNNESVSKPVFIRLCSLPVMWLHSYYNQKFSQQDSKKHVFYWIRHIPLHVNYKTWVSVKILQENPSKTILKKKKNMVKKTRQINGRKRREREGGKKNELYIE